DGKTLASADEPLPEREPSKEKPTVRLWDLGSHEQRHAWEQESARSESRRIFSGADIPGLFFSPDSRLLAVHAPNNRLSLHDVKSGRMRRQIATGEDSRVGAAAFSPDSRSLAWSAGDGIVRLLDLESGRARARWSGLSSC